MYIKFRLTLFVFLLLGGILLATNFTYAATVNYYADPSGTDDVSHGTGTGTDAWATIQYAISNVSNPTSDTIIINIAEGIYTTNNDDIAINRNFLNLNLQGAAANTTIVQSHTNPDLSTVEVFDIESNNNVIFNDMTIRYGRTNTSGAAIQAGSGNLTINDSIIYDNDGISSGDSGGISGSGDLTIKNSTFYDNSSQYSAVMYWSNGNVVITNSTFFNNDSTNYMGLYFNGIGSLTITNSIITKGSSLELQGSFDTYIKNSIIADGSSYDLEYYNYYGTVYTENTIIGVEDTDGSAPYIINGTNGNIDINNDDLSTINIKTKISENGAANNTLTLALEKGSPAINAGDSSANNGVLIPTTDQRGQTRVSTVDIGPFEYNGSDSADPLITSQSIDSNNTYVDITFDEGVYNTNGGSGGLEASDLSVTLTQGSGDVTGITIDSVTKTDFGTLVGGETTIRVNISLTGIARGVETITFSPASSSSIYDAAGNSMSTNQITSALTLDGSFQYYVDPTGTDDGSHGTGTGTDAWATIEYAINNVSSPSTDPATINIASGTYTTGNDTININRSFTDLTLSGAGATNTIIQPHTDPASSTVEVFNAASSNNVIYEDMTIRYGRTSTSGAGIQAGSGNTTIRRCIIQDNDGKSSYDSGGISGTGNLTIENSTFYDNSSQYSAVMYWSNGDVVITNSTFFNNDSTSYMGLYFNGIGSLTITNSIITKGSSLELQGSFDAYIKNSIIADGSGYDLEYYNYYGTVYAENTIIGVEDTGGSAPYIINGTNGNIDINNDDLSTINISTSLASNNTINGTPTLALLAGSSAINAGDSSANNGVSIPGADQRGATRASTVDIGPYEYGGVISAPYISEYYPADNATAIAISSNLVLTFSESVDAESGNVVLHKTSDDSVVQTFDVTSDISGSGTDTITINPSSNLNDLTSYYIKIDATAFDNASSNSYAGISDTSTWNFTTGDETSPTVSSFSPADNATEHATSSNLILTFSESVDAESGNIVLYKTSDDSVIQTFDVTSDISGSGTDTITINPSSNLDESTSYYIKIDATAFDDASSNSYAGITDATTWNFTTADETSPTISSFSPADNATAIAISSNLVLTFSESVDAESGNVVLHKTSDDSVVQTFDVTSDISGSGTDTITINPTNDLSYETSYYIKIDATAFDDASSNSYAGITDATTWNFTTENTPTCPTISNAATYNAYPTCGVATCNSGYTVKNDACVANGGGSAPAPAPSVGVGQADISIGISQTGNVGRVHSSGVNILGHIHSIVNFETMVSNYHHHIFQNHRIAIIDLDLFNNIVTLEIHSKPQIIKLKLDEAENIDLDGDSIEDIKIKFEDIVINRAELTVIPLSDKEEDKIIKEEDKIIEDKINIKKVLNIPFHFIRNLKIGIRGQDVKELQKYLNDNGYLIAKTGYGSLNNETEYFGNATKNALIRFQNKYAKEILKPVGLSRGTGYFGPSTIKFVNLSKTNSTVAENKKIGSIREKYQEEAKKQIKIFSLFTKGLSLGMKNNDIKKLQELLSTIPDVYSEGIISGYFGTLTEKAVQRFQLKYKVVNNNHDIGYGYVGPATRAKLNKVFGSKYDLKK